MDEMENPEQAHRSRRNFEPSRLRDSRDFEMSGKSFCIYRDVQGKSEDLGQLAQLVERHPYKVDVIGSIPILPTISSNSPFLRQKRRSSFGALGLAVRMWWVYQCLFTGGLVRLLLQLENRLSQRGEK